MSCWICWSIEDFLALIPIQIFLRRRRSNMDNIKNVNIMSLFSGEKYTYLVTEFGEEKIEERFKAIYEYLQTFVEQNCLQDQVYVCVELLEHMLVDYFVDIYRLKKFHHIKKVNDNKLFFKILTYPGADEVSNTLFARLLNEYYNKRPLVYLFYPAEKAKTVIPCAEDRYLDISAKYQILAAGCLFTPSLKDADLIFAINAPSKTMISSQFRESSDDGYSVNRNLLDFINFIDYCINVLNKPVCIGDVGYCNGGDLALITLIEQKKMYLKLAGYASWNIPCNSLGTALPMGIRYLYPHDQQLFNNFLIHRFVEDVGYCTLARKILREQYCNDEFSIYDTKQMRGKFSELAKKIIIEQVNKYMPTLKDKYKILDAYMPWIRTYEIGLKVIYTGDNDE